MNFGEEMVRLVVRVLAVRSAWGNLSRISEVLSFPLLWAKIKPLLTGVPNEYLLGSSFPLLDISVKVSEEGNREGQQ